MKKHLIFNLLSLIFLSWLSAGAVKKVEANPINVAVMLMQENDTAGIASTLKYYGYIPDTSDSHNALRATHNAQDGYAVFTHPKGSTIRISFTEHAENGQRKTANLQDYTVEVSSKSTAKKKTGSSKISTSLRSAAPTCKKP